MRGPCLLRPGVEICEPKEPLNPCLKSESAGCDPHPWLAKEDWHLLQNNEPYPGGKRCAPATGRTTVAAVPSAAGALAVCAAVPAARRPQRRRCADRRRASMWCERTRKRKGARFKSDAEHGGRSSRVVNGPIAVRQGRAAEGRGGQTGAGRGVWRDYSFYSLCLIPSIGKGERRRAAAGRQARRRAASSVIILSILCAWLDVFFLFFSILCRPRFMPGPFSATAQCRAHTPRLGGVE